jgi:hypothetical protein
MDPACLGIRNSQELAHLHPSAAHRRRDPQSRQNPKRLGMEYRQKGSQESQLRQLASTQLARLGRPFHYYFLHHRPISRSSLFSESCRFLPASMIDCIITNSTILHRILFTPLQTKISQRKQYEEPANRVTRTRPHCILDRYQNTHIDKGIILNINANILN